MNNKEIALAVKLLNNIPGNAVSMAADPDFHLSSDGDGFALDIWFSLTKEPAVNQPATLFQCGDGFQLLIKEDTLYLKTSSKEECITDTFTLKIQDWHNICLNFSYSVLDVYMDGLFINKRQWDSFDVTGGEYVLGLGFAGFIRSLRMYTKHLLLHEYTSILYAAHSTALPAGIPIGVWYDFSQYPPKELIKSYKINIKANALAYISNITKFSNNQRFVFSNDAQNGVSAYTLLTRICFSMPNTTTQYIFTRAANTKISLKLTEQNDLFIIQCDIGNAITLKSGTYQAGDIAAWFDIAVACGSQGTTLYVNGIAQQSGAAFPGINSLSNVVTIGNSADTMQNAGLNGYISYLAEYTQCLTCDEINALIKNPPFIFDQGIHALYSFNQKDPREEVSDTKLSALQAGYAYASGNATQATVEDIYYNNSNDAFSANDYKTWKTNTFMEVFSLFIGSIYGLSPTSGFVSGENKLLKEVGALLNNEYVCTSAFENIMIKAPFIDRDTVEPMLCDFQQDSGLLDRLLDLFYTGNYFKKMTVYNSSLNFLTGYFLDRNDVLQTAFDHFFELSKTKIFDDIIENKVSFDNGVIKAHAVGVSFQEEDDIAYLNADIRFNLTNFQEKVTVYVTAFAPPIYFSYSDEVEGEITLQEETLHFKMPLNDPDPDFQLCDRVSFALRFSQEENSVLLDYFILAD